MKKIFFILALLAPIGALGQINLGVGAFVGTTQGIYAEVLPERFFYKTPMSISAIVMAGHRQGNEIVGVGGRINYAFVQYENRNIAWLYAGAQYRQIAGSEIAYAVLELGVMFYNPDVLPIGVNIGTPFDNYGFRNWNFHRFEGGLVFIIGARKWR